MKNIEFRAVENLEVLLNMLDAETRSYSILSGGTDLLVLLKEFILSPECVYDVSRIGELNFIRTVEDAIEIGAAVCMSDIIRNPEACLHVPILVSALREVGSPLIRNRATLGGNVGNSSPAGDSIPALMVLDSMLKLVSKAGERSVSIHDFITGPRKNILKKGEIIKSFTVQKMNSAEVSFFQKAGSRKALAISKANLALRALIENGTVRMMKLSFGSVGPVVIKAEKIPGLLVGKTLTDELVEQSCGMVPSEIKPISDFRSTSKYRVKVLENLLRKCLHELA